MPEPVELDCPETFFIPYIAEDAFFTVSMGDCDEEMVPIFSTMELFVAFMQYMKKDGVEAFHTTHGEYALDVIWKDGFLVGMDPHMGDDGQMHLMLLKPHHH